jgi:hypothetical protein
MFDTTVELIGASVGEVNVDQGQEGVLELVFVSGLTLPVAGNDGQPVRIPSGTYRFQLTRSQALEYFQKAVDAAEGLPKGSDLVVPTSEAEVEEVAKTMEGIKQNG